MEGLRAEHGGRVEPPPFDPRRDPRTGLVNGETILAYAKELAAAVLPLLESQRFPVVLGGDCSILLGPLLALRRRGRYGLFFIDGHADFYQPEAEPSGEVASMELALASGRGPPLLADIDGLGPLVRDEDIVAFGFRDQELAAREGSQNVRATPIVAYGLDQVRSAGARKAAEEALRRLAPERLDGLWVHLDADVLDDEVMPAVDYRQPGGLSLDELSEVLRTAVSGWAVGMTITIYNPTLDPDGSIGRGLVNSVLSGLAGTSAFGSMARALRRSPGPQHL